MHCGLQFLIHGGHVAEVAQLAGLRYAHACTRPEALALVELPGFVGRAEEVVEQEEADDEGAGPALAVVAVHGDHPAAVGQQELLHFVAGFDEGAEDGGAVVFPVEGHALALELGVVVVAAAYVDHQEVVAVVFVEQPGHFVDRVTVGLLQARGGEGHGDDPGGDVGEVQVVALLHVALLGPSHDLPDLAQHQFTLASTHIRLSSRLASTYPCSATTCDSRHRVHSSPSACAKFMKLLSPLHSRAQVAAMLSPQLATSSTSIPTLRLCTKSSTLRLLCSTAFTSTTLNCASALKKSPSLKLSWATSSTGMRMTAELQKAKSRSSSSSLRLKQADSLPSRQTSGDLSPSSLLRSRSNTAYKTTAIEVQKRAQNCWFSWSKTGTPENPEKKANRKIGRTTMQFLCRMNSTAVPFLRYIQRPWLNSSSDNSRNYPTPTSAHCIASLFSRPFIPTPTSASRIIPTSLLPSPTAITQPFCFTSSHSLPFWLGEILAATTGLALVRSTNCWRSSSLRRAIVLPSTSQPTC